MRFALFLICLFAGHLKSVAVKRASSDRRGCPAALSPSSGGADALGVAGTYAPATGAYILSSIGVILKPEATNIGDEDAVIRITGEFILAGVFLISAILTAVNPQWIEAVFHIDPDGGSGAFEWIMVGALGLLAVVAAGLGTRTAGLRRRTGEA